MIRRSLRAGALWTVLLLGSLPLVAGAAPRKLTLGVFLPTSLDDGQARFELGVALAEALSKALEQPVTAKNFGRFEDYARASAEGTLDLGLVEAWAAAESAAKAQPVAFAVLGGESLQRWAVVAPGVDAVAELAGKRLAVTRGALGMDAAFVSHVVFGGDLVANKHFKLIAVPAVESALQMVSAKSAEAALVPLANVPKGARVVYRSARVVGPIAVSFKGSAEDAKRAFLAVGAVAPLEPFVELRGTEVADLRKLISKGPPPRQPIVAESPVARPNLTGLLDLRAVGLGFPSFLEAAEVPPEQPND